MSCKPFTMQNIEVIHSSTARPFADLGADKGLPHRDIISQAESNNLNTRFALPNMPKDDTASWLTNQLEKPLIVNNARPSGLPPTPPMHLQEASSGRKQGGIDRINSHSELSTPVNQRSPPTPDSTPPRDQEKILGLQPPTTQRNLSSRTDSFTTACEDQSSSDEEGTRPELPSLNGEYDEYDDLTPLAQSKELNVGLDIPHEVNLDDPDEDKTPTAERTRIEFGTDDGCRDAGIGTQGQKHGNSNMEDLTIPKERERAPASSALTEHPPETVLADTVLTDLKSDLYERIGSSLRERIRRNKENADRPSTLKFAEEIAWPTTMVSMNPDEGNRSMDNKRFSGMSNTSTIIEAYVVDIHTPRRRTLRHVGKNVNLRARISSAPAAVSSSGPRCRPKHRLVHKKSNEDMKRASLVSDHSPVLEPKNESLHDSTEHIPVMVIPQQRQTMFKTRPESVPTVVSSSPSVSSDSQPNVGAAWDGYFDLPVRRKTLIGDQENGDQDQDIMNSSRRSTVIAAKNHDPSSTTSLIPVVEGAGAETHFQGTTAAQIAKGGVNDSTQGKNRHVESTHLFTPITPYPQLSIDSRTEALEVSEATAISIFPHHSNNSLLVVQQQSHPLQTGRGSPKPPALQIIPPTPDVLSLAAEHDRQLGGPASKSGLVQNVRAGRALERVKRALSNRRYSDSFLAPFTLFRTVDESTQTTGNYHRRRPSLGECKDSKLSPFWRPRGFWDDLEVSDEDVKDEFLERGRVELFERPVSRTRQRLEEDEDRQSAHSVHRRRPTDNMKTIKSRAGGGRVHTIPALGMQIEFIGWRGVHRRLRDIKAAKKTKTKERERERFKGRISPPTAIDPTMV